MKDLNNSELFELLINKIKIKQNAYIFEYIILRMFFIFDITNFINLFDNDLFNLKKNSISNFKNFEKNIQYNNYKQFIYDNCCIYNKYMTEHIKNKKEFIDVDYYCIDFKLLY